MSTDATTWFVATSREQKRRVTINDVARKAGVNKGTVSRALRGMEGVGEETRRRIFAAAEELDYSASELGTALATGFTRTVGIVLPSLRSWYFSEVASGASEVLSGAGFRVELINLDIDSDFLQIDSEQFAKLFRQLGAGRSRDALLFAGTTSIPDGDEGKALVPVAAHGGPLVTAPGVFVDHREGGRLAARHLTGLGHTSLAMVDGRMAGKVDVSIWELRAAGFLAGVAEAGLDPESVLLLRPGDCHTADGERVGRQLLESPDRLPGAIFCQSDELAFGLIASLRRHDVQCPRDVSVAGFDDHP
ncbi:MAG TPA: LacI family DNA-binding transcriptional regulator, partial [Microlunatus sp.]|nr:LacI family DNA-binding transcriptional regulator [Microlunatus sp.]